jgi:hypothetical protein
MATAQAEDAAFHFTGLAHFPARERRPSRLFMV